MVDKLTATIGNGLASKLVDFRFLKSKWCLTRKIPNGSQSIAIEALPTSPSTFAKLAAHAHVRIDTLECIYAQHIPFLDSREIKTHQTVVVNCDRLLSNGSLIHSFRTDEESVKRFISDYAESLGADVLPWLERYSDEQNLFENLNENEPQKWLTSNRLIRYPVLLALLAKRNNWTRFGEIRDEFLEYCNQPHTEVYRPMAVAVATGIVENYKAPES